MITPHALDAQPDDELKIKEEYRDENGDLDTQQLLDDIDVATSETAGHSDMDTLRAVRHAAGKRVKHTGDE